MLPLIVVDNPQTWSLTIPGAELVAARTYLAEHTYASRRDLRVFNLCRSYRYQTTGYYVSLLAMARGHKPLPSITTIQDMKSLAIKRLVSDELDVLMQKSLRHVSADSFVISIYFGRNLAKRYNALSNHLFRRFRAPFLRAEFERDEGRWRLRRIRLLAVSDIPANHHDFAITAAYAYFEQRREPAVVRNQAIYSLAILRDPHAALPPSNPGAIERFIDAGRKHRFYVECIDHDDYSRLAEFDALFIRETTAVNHHTYRFARRAAAEGLVVIDDPDSILKCTNKVFLAELLDRHGIRHPRTVIVGRENRDAIPAAIGFPCVIKKPDSSFSQGVIKADDPPALENALDQLFADSDLVIAQEFLPTPFDWRIGILDNNPIFACKYHMAPKHWQIIQTDPDGHTRDGKVQAVPLHAVPTTVVSTALRAARLIGDGLYGVDLKQIGRKVYVIEVNDNPNIDHGFEDRLQTRALYNNIISVFLKRILRIKGRIVLRENAL